MCTLIPSRNVSQQTHRSLPPMVVRSSSHGNVSEAHVHEGTAVCKWVGNPRSFSTFRAWKYMGLLSGIPFFPPRILVSVRTLPRGVFFGQWQTLVVHTDFNGRFFFSPGGRIFPWEIRFFFCFLVLVLVEILNLFANGGMLFSFSSYLPFAHASQYARTYNHMISPTALI